MPSRIIPVHELCPKSDFENPNDLINLGIIIDILIRDINYKIYKVTSKEDENLRKSDPLVLIPRAYSSDFDLKVHELPTKDNYFDAKITLEERFKFASSEFMHKYLEEKGIEISPDYISNLFVAFRDKGFVKDVENEVIKVQLKTTREKLKEQKNYYHILGNSFFEWRENKKNIVNLTEKLQDKYKNEFILIPQKNLVEIIDSALVYHAQKRIFARLVQNAIDNDSEKYYGFFNTVFTDKEANPDTQENNLLKAQVCAAASFYDRNINNYKEIIHQEYPDFDKNKIIDLDDFGSTLVVEAIRKKYRYKHGLVPNVGRTIKINSFSNLRNALMNLQTQKIIAHSKSSINLTEKTDTDSFFKACEFIGINYVMKLIDRRFLTKGKDLIDYFIEEARKNSPEEFHDIDLKLNGDKLYTYGLMENRWEYFKRAYIFAQNSHDRVSCRKA